MIKHRNTGAHFQRKDGSWVGRGEVFTPTAEELAQMSYKLRPAPEAEEATEVRQRTAHAPRVLDAQVTEPTEV